MQRFASGPSEKDSGHFPFSSRLALVAGFGSILVIMTLAGLDALRVLQDVRGK